MIAKTEWFNRRKYGGWGVVPSTKQGWFYVLFMFLPFLVFHILPFWNSSTRVIVTVVWILFLIFDLIPVMIQVPKDEREKMHEAIAERNASWSMVFTLVFVILFDILKQATNQKIEINWSLFVVLLVGVITKAISNIVLERTK